MQGITDGEFRRTLWHADFFSQIDGIKVVEGLAAGFGEAFSKPRLRRAALADTIRRDRESSGITHGIEVENFKFLASVTKQTAKQCIPSPSLVHFRTGRGGVDKTAYPEMEEFFADLARVFREEIAQLAAAGCTLFGDRRRELRLSLRSQDARRREEDRRGSGQAAVFVRQSDQRMHQRPACRIWPCARISAAAISPAPGLPKAATIRWRKCCSTS